MQGLVFDKIVVNNGYERELGYALSSLCIEVFVRFLNCEPWIKLESTAEYLRLIASAAEHFQDLGASFDRFGVCERSPVG